MRSPKYPFYPGDVSNTDWSYIPAWDAIAAARAFQATHDPRALARAIAAYDAVVESDAYSGGAWSRDLETDANVVKTALLLFDISRQPRYLREARVTYALIRSRNLDPTVPLYTVYLEDSGARCT